MVYMPILQLLLAAYTPGPSKTDKERAQDEFDRKQAHEKELDRKKGITYIIY